LADLNTIRQQTTQARKQLETQRANVQIQREQAQKQEKSLREARKKLPVRTSQRALRQKMAGLIGRKKRREIKKVETKIEEQKKGVEKYKEGLTTYETETLKPFETKLKAQEAEIKRVDEYNSAVRAVEKAKARGKLWAIAAFGEGLERELAREYIKQKNLAKASFSRQVEDFQMQYPTEKLDVDWKNLRIKGVQSGALQQSLSWKNYNATIKDLEKVKIVDMPPVKIEGSTSYSLFRPTGLSTLSSKNINLSRMDVSKVNGYSNINRNILGNDIRTLGISNGKLGNGDSFINRLGSSLKNVYTKTFKKDTEIFQPTGNVISEYKPVEHYELPKKTTWQKITSLPMTGLVSAREFSERQSALTGSEKLLGIGSVASIDNKRITTLPERVENIVFPNRKAIKELKGYDIKLEQKTKEFNDLKNYQIPKFENQNLQNGKFDYNELTPTKQKEYDKLINKANKVREEYNNLLNLRETRTRETSKTFRAHDYYKEVPVTELASPLGYVGAYVSTVGEMTGEKVGDIYSGLFIRKDKGISKGIFTSTGQLVKGEITGKEWLGGFKKTKAGEFQVWDLDKGTAKLGTKEDIASVKNAPLMFLQPEEVSKGSAKVFKIGSYFLPFVGEPIFWSEIGESVAESDYKPLKFIKEHPVEAGVTSLFLATKIKVKASKYLKEPVIKPTKEGFIKTTRADEFFGKEFVWKSKGKYTRGGGGKLWEIEPSKRGTYVKYKEIPKPVVDLYTKPIAEDITYLTKEGGKNIVSYPKQQVSQVGRAGRLTEVKVFKKGLFGEGKMKDIYSGLPTDKLGREKALKLLEDLKNKESILRFTAPTIYKGKIKTFEPFEIEKITIPKFIQTTEQPVIDLGGGIKTRGARTKLYPSIGARKSVIKDENLFGLEVETTLKAVKHKEPAIDLLGFDIKKKLIKSKVVSKGDVYVKTKDIKGLTIYEKVPFEEVKSFSAGTYVPQTNKVFADTGGVYLFKKTIKDKGLTGVEKGIKGGKKSSEEYFNKLYLEEEAQKTILKAPPTIMQPPIKQIKIVSPEPVVTPEMNLPLMVGGAGLKTIPFSGLAIYEVAPSVSIEKQNLELKTIPLIKQDVKIESASLTKLSTGLKSFTATKPSIDLKYFPGLKENLKLKPIMKQELGLKQELRMKQDLGMKSITKQEQILKPREEIIKPKIQIITTSTKKKTPYKDILSRITRGTYEVFERKKGKATKTGTEKSLEKAIQKLKWGLKGGLQASGWIVEKKTGKKIKFEKLANLLGKEFRASKLSPFIAVQKKGKRLGTRKETRKIQKERTFFRRSNGKFKFF